LFTESTLNEGVVSDGNTLLVELEESTLVDELADGLKVGVTISNVRFNETKHVNGGLVELYKHTVVDLTEAEELQDLAGLWGNGVDTADANNKGQLSLGRHIKVTGSLGLATKDNLLAVSSAILLDVLLGALEDFTAVGLGSLLGLGFSSSTLSYNLFCSLALLENALRNLGELLSHDDRSVFF